MTVAAGAFPLVGTQPVTNSTTTGVEVANLAAGYIPLIPVGTITAVVDPYWGGLELIRLQVPAGNSIRVGTVSILGPTYSFVAVPNAANLGQSVVVSFNDIPNNATFSQYAWFVMSGRYMVLNIVGAVVADNPLGINGVGLAGANTIGKQILNARVVLAANSQITKPCNLKLGSSTFTAPNSDGWFVGGSLFGTGVPVPASIGAISVDGVTISMVTPNTTTPVNATATTLSNIQQSYSDGTRFWNICSLDRPFAQGAIT